MSTDDHIRDDLRHAVLRARDAFGMNISVQTIDETDIVRIVDVSDETAPVILISDWLTTDEAVVLLDAWIEELGDARTGDWRWLTKPTPITIDGREVYDRAKVDAFIAEFELMIGRLRQKLDESTSAATSSEADP